MVSIKPHSFSSAVFVGLLHQIVPWCWPTVALCVVIMWCSQLMTRDRKGSRFNDVAMLWGFYYYYYLTNEAYCKAPVWTIFSTGCISCLYMMHFGTPKETLMTLKLSSKWGFGSTVLLNCACYIYRCFCFVLFFHWCKRGRQNSSNIRWHKTIKFSSNTNKVDHPKCK